MYAVPSQAGIPIRLTDERWRHISLNHPECATMRPQVLQTVADPDLIQAGDGGALLAIRKYWEKPLTDKFMVVPYREVSGTDGFILTAYLTNSPSIRRTVLWRR